MAVASHNKGAIFLLASAVWVVLIRTIFWNLGYNRIVQSSSTIVVASDILTAILALVYILLAGMFWLRFTRGYRVGLAVATVSVVFLIASGLFSEFLWPDFPLIILQLLVVYFSLRAYSDYQREKAKAVHPMEYPVFG